jgi:aspartate aminotransferase
MFLEPGDCMAFCVPSWNNGYYAQLCGAEPTLIPTLPENNFFPTKADLEPALSQARLFTLNSPLNPTGTVISKEQLLTVASAVLEENQRRKQTGTAPLLWMWDQVYWQLCYGVQHHHPAVLLPEVAPYLITIDAVSKMWAATGLRVGWAVLPPVLAERMGALVGHMGAWAPRPYQAATAALLNEPAKHMAFMEEFRAKLQARLQKLSAGLSRLGIPHLVPQGAMYLSVQFPFMGRPGVDGQPIQSNEEIRRYLLAKAGIAVVPFQAFDLENEGGWFRISVGAVSLESLDAALDRLGRIV